MYKPGLMIRNLTIGAVLWATATATSATITFSISPASFNTPIGIDWYEPTSMLIMSVNYPSGSPNNLDLVNPAGGAHTMYSSLVGLLNEVKVATVRSSSCQGGFTVGDAFIGNGLPGQVAKVGSGGAPVTFTFATLPGETALVRGSLFQDRFCAAGGDLIVVTGNEQNGSCPNDCVGNVWRVTSAGTATLVASASTHLEGVTTVPNDPTLYGPLAGRILAGAEQFAIPAGPPTYDPAGGLIVAVNPNALNDFFTIGGPGTSGIGGHTHYVANNAFHPEDLDVIRANADFFGVNYGVFPAGHLLTAAAGDFASMCGQVLITQEFPFAGTSGLSALQWTGSTALATAFAVTPLTSNLDGQIPQWEHVTFTSGQDCFGLRVVKSPKNGTFNYLGQATFTIVVTNTGALPDAITLTDALPGNGGLVWTNASPTQGSCTNPIVGNSLSCNLGTVAAGASVTVTVTSTATTPAAACQDQPNAAAIATDTHGNTAQDNGFLTCTLPGSYTLTKNPKGASYNIGDQVNFTMVVTSAGPGTANNVVLNDPLPTLGNLNSWTFAPSGNPGNICNINAGNTLNCPFGNLANGQTRTVTVTTNVTGGANATACTGAKLNNIATLTGTGLPSLTDTGDWTCQPGSYTLTKNPKGATYNIGDNITFTMVVTSTGPGTANNVVLNDPLPTLGNLNSWTITTNPGGVCSITSNTLNCPFGNLANGQTRTVVVATNAAGGANATACTGATLNNTATLTGTGLTTKTDTGDYTCQPGSYTLAKSPKNATYNIGDNINFTITVTSTGPGRANNVVLNDPLPTLGNLNSWTITTNPGGVCTISSNTLNCPFGNLANGQTRTVVVATNAAGGANATACTGAKLNNTATLTGTGLTTKTDTGDYTCTPPATNLQTVTQGGWHAPPHGNNPGTVLNAYFSAHPGYQPKIGDITNACGGKTLTFTSANAIRAFLPAGSTPGVLTATATNPTSSSAGVFAGQVLALTLNTQVLSSGSSLLSFVLTSGPATGKTVGQVLADADKAIGGCGLPSYVTSISQLNDIVDTINNMFD